MNFRTPTQKSEILSTLTSALGPLVIGSWGLFLPPTQHVHSRELAAGKKKQNRGEAVVGANWKEGRRTREVVRWAGNHTEALVLVAEKRRQGGR
jgi:hypothetical protein